MDLQSTGSLFIKNYNSSDLHEGANHPSGIIRTVENAAITLSHYQRIKGKRILHIHLAT
jgi:hypothetical protein